VPRDNAMQRMGSQFRPPVLEPFHQGVQGGILAALLTQQLLDPQTGLPRAVNAFAYCPTPFNPLVAATTATASVNISNTHDFLVFAVTGTLRNPAAPFAEDADAAVTIQVVADSSDSSLTERATDWSNVVGNGRDPNWLPVPLFWRGSTSVTITLTNLMATDVIARLSFIGCKVFYGSMG
jgi:hypothetical protein